MIIHILEKIDTIKSIKEIVIVCADEYRSFIEAFLKEYDIKKTVVFASAGKTRQASVYSGLKKVQTEDVIIHEAARPLVTTEDYMSIINNKEENVMIGSQIPFTVVKGHDYLEGILTRSELVNVQLPQKFKTRQLLESHTKAEADGLEFTEDSTLLLYYNPDIKIKIIQGKDYNIKITTRTDLLTGEIIFDEFFRRRK